ncbi:MAG: O-antigen ligase family protein [Planctomycetia bacterium]|nr:O-antigen ligase family protein [Planctomycetia bacterium]
MHKFHLNPLRYGMKISLVFDKIILYGLIFLIVFISVVPYSLAMQWSLLAITVLGVVILVFSWLFRDIYQGNVTFLKTPLHLPAIAFLVLAVFQLVPLPAPVLRYISPSSASVYNVIDYKGFKEVSTLLTRNDNTPDRERGETMVTEETHQKTESELIGKDTQKWHPITLYPYASKVELYRLLIYLGIYFLIINNIRSRRQVTYIVATILITAASLAFLAILQYVSGTGKIFWLFDMEGTSFFGTFTNRDHFACYMGMTLPLGIGLLIKEYLRYSGKRYPPNNPGRNPFAIIKSFGSHGLSELPGHMIFFYVCAVVIMLSSLFLARSGGGMLGITASSLLFIGMLRCRKRLRKLTWVVLPVIIVTFAMLVWVGIQPVVEEFSANIDIENPSLWARIAFWKDSVQAVKDFPIFGSGLGVFPYIYPQYDTVTRYTQRNFVNHAHNDYLELLLETGAVGLAIVLWAWYRFIKDAALYHILGLTKGIGHTQSVPQQAPAHEPFRKRNDPFIIGIAMGGILGTISIAFHCIVEFNLHTPANAFLLSVLLGITTVVVHMKNENDQP